MDAIGVCDLNICSQHCQLLESNVTLLALDKYHGREPLALAGKGPTLSKNGATGLRVATNEFFT